MEGDFRGTAEAELDAVVADFEDDDLDVVADDDLLSDAAIQNQHEKPSLDMPFRHCRNTHWDLDRHVVRARGPQAGSAAVLLNVG
jgi:hypothetical protein